MCDTCDPTYASDFDIEIIGMADGACGSCDMIDGVYRVTRDDSGCGALSFCCRWFMTYSPGLCGNGSNANSVEMILWLNGANYQINVKYIYGNPPYNGYTEWVKVIGASKPDCAAFAAYNIPYQGDLVACDGSGSTLTITAVP